MDRRSFLKSAVAISLAAGVADATAAERYFPTKVDQTLFEGINRVKNPDQKTPLEKSHAPVLTAPATAKVGEPFFVEVSVGETLHPMGATHWIENIELNVGNEPAGYLALESRGYLKPRAGFTVILPTEAASGGKVTLIARQRCNLHGLWEGSIDIALS